MWPAEPTVFTIWSFREEACQGLMDELTPLPFPNGRTVATAVFAQTPCYNAPGRKRLSFV